MKKVKRWNRCAQGSTDVEHQHINVVYQYDPLKLKNEVCHISPFSPAKIGEKGETGVHWGGTYVEHQQINIVYQ